jgi:signal transduction histidine kinase
LPQRRKSIAATVSLALIAVTTVVLGARVVSLHLSERDALHRELRACVSSDADRVAAALELPVWNLDRTQIDRVIETTLRAPEVLAVVVEAAGRTHAMTQDAEGRHVPFDGQVSEPGVLREDRDVVLGETRIGHVAVFATPRRAEARLRQTLVGHVIGAAVLALVMVGVLWLVLRRVVIAPLRALERYAEAVSAGERPGAAPPGARLEGELATLSDAMQHMVALLDTRYAQLEAAEASIHALASRLQATREEEKTRIARDLHDDLGQLLTAVQMELRWVEERLAEHPEAALANALTDHVVEAARLTEDTAKSVQRIAADLRPSALDTLGLGAALQAEGRRFHERAGVPCAIAVEGDLPELAPDAATALYRVAQEALTNVARHAHASRVTVTLAARDAGLCLRVEDDGSGLAGPAAGRHALGLLGMKERAAMLGGEVTFTPGAAQGTVVELRVPLARVVASGERRALQ